MVVDPAGRISIEADASIVQIDTSTAVFRLSWIGWNLLGYPAPARRMLRNQAAEGGAGKQQHGRYSEGEAVHPELIVAPTAQKGPHGRADLVARVDQTEEDPGPDGQSCSLLA